MTGSADRTRSIARSRWWAGVLFAVAALGGGVLGACSTSTPVADSGLGAAGGDGGVAVRSASVGEGERIAAGYFVISGGEADDRLVGASSPSAASVSLHRTDASGAMRATDAVAVPAGATVPFVPGGDHLMLEGLVAPLLPGDDVIVNLEFERAGVVEVTAPVVALVDVLDVYDGGW